MGFLEPMGFLGDEGSGALAAAPACPEAALTRLPDLEP